MEQETINLLIPVIGAVLTFFVGFGTWYLNEHSKRTLDEYKRKEEKYLELIRSLTGFYEHSSSEDLITEFLDQLKLCWMYCPDEVIHKAYNFLTVGGEERKKATGELMLAIRKDLFSRKPLKKTSLKAEDFQHLRA